MSTDNLWITGGASGGGGEIYHVLDGVEDDLYHYFSDHNSELCDIAPFSDSDIWTVGYNETDKYTIVVHYDGDDWIEYLTTTTGFF